MTDYQILVCGFGIALTVVLLPSVINGKLHRNVKRFVLIGAFCVYTALNFLNFAADALATALFKSLSLSLLMAAGSLWMARVYREHEAKRSRSR